MFDDEQALELKQAHGPEIVKVAIDRLLGDFKKLSARDYIVFAANALPKLVELTELLITASQRDHQTIRAAARIISEAFAEDNLLDAWRQHLGGGLDVLFDMEPEDRVLHILNVLAAK